MITQGMHLKDLVRALGWDYATLWSMPNRNTELVWADGSFEANPLKRYDSEYWNVERLFSSAYKSCAFALGSGYVGTVLKDGQPLWLNGIDDLIHHSNTSSQAHFFKVAGVQTLLCVPWFTSVVELGSSSLLIQNADLVIQIRSFLSHMATSHQQMTNAYLPLESSFISQDLSGGSDDASFNGGHQVESCSSFPPQAPLVEISSSTERRTTVEEHDLSEEVVRGSAESDWRFELASSEMLQKNLTSSPSLRSTLTKQKLQQEEVELVEGADFGSSFLICPRQQMPLLNQIDYNHSSSTSHSSSRDDNINHFLSVSKGNLEQQPGNDHYFPRHQNSNVSRKCTAAAGFMPWNPTARNSFQKGVQKSSCHSNQMVLRRCINMTHKIPQLTAWREAQRAAEEKSIAAGRPITVSAVEEVLSGHDEAAVNHMLAERKRRQKQKENFCALRSLIPFVSKMDRASILGDAISYVKQLTARIEELEFLNRELVAQLPGFQRKRSRSSTITSL